ncbi:DNA/RNA non-specific endonuclease domain-containing protein [Ditylenchus destructor]|nr:DNA/RNA non-specific endonuclease domain-containing protein [Ditylenchus destructor]
MSPQVGKGFNRDKWNDLERKLAKKHKNIYVCTGPLYLPCQEADGNFYVKYKLIGANRVAVPTHFFKVALIETDRDKYEMEAYMMPNQFIPDEKPISDFLVPLESIERAAGFLIFEHANDKVVKFNGQSTGRKLLNFF